ncbi:hypothetical protein BsWGS_26177 [Bradybaena similaris]
MWEKKVTTMKQNGIRTICAAFFVIILCCNCIPSGHGWKLEDAQDDGLMQRQSELLPLPTSSRVGELKLLSLLLQQRNAQGPRGYVEGRHGLHPSRVSSRGISGEIPAEGSDREAAPEKRQRPCFWSVVTCY